MSPCQKSCPPDKIVTSPLPKRHVPVPKVTSRCHSIAQCDTGWSFNIDTEGNRFANLAVNFHTLTSVHRGGRYRAPSRIEQTTESQSSPVFFQDPQCDLYKNHGDDCLNPLTPNDDYSGRTAPLTPKRFILCIYSTNIATEYFKHGIDSPFFSSSKCSLFHKSNVFGSCIVHILCTGCVKIKKNNSGAKRLRNCRLPLVRTYAFRLIDCKTGHFSLKQLNLLDYAPFAVGF